MATTNNATQTYTVLVSNGNIEIRRYPSAIMATTKMYSKTYTELGKQGFSKLSGYIFGGNHANQKIGMTSPVHMEIENNNGLMSFVMPAEYDLEKLPQPKDVSVHLSVAPNENAAVIQFGGYINERKIEKNTLLLKKYLLDNSIESYGNFRVLGYNSPYQFFNRRNEIIVSIRYISN